MEADDGATASIRSRFAELQQPAPRIEALEIALALGSEATTPPTRLRASRTTANTRRTKPGLRGCRDPARAPLTTTTMIDLLHQSSSRNPSSAMVE